MIDVSSKQVTQRKAKATCYISMNKKSFKILLNQGSPKGDVFECAKVAGVLAAKATPQLIPMCHPLEISKIHLRFELDRKNAKIQIISEVAYKGRTGVEMEALAAASVAALTIYDMMKWADKSMVISELKLVFKSGGRSGTYLRQR